MLYKLCLIMELLCNNNQNDAQSHPFINCTTEYYTLFNKNLVRFYSIIYLMYSGPYSVHSLYII